MSRVEFERGTVEISDARALHVDVDAPKSDIDAAVVKVDNQIGKVLIKMNVNVDHVEEIEVGRLTTHNVHIFNGPLIDVEKNALCIWR